jgi:hypothetical protein
MKHLLLPLAVIGGLAACSRGGEPEAVIEEMVRLAETGRCDRVPQLVTKASSQGIGALLEQACKMGVEERNKSGKAAPKLKRINVLSRTESGDKTMVRAEPEYEDGSKQGAEDFVMVKEGGEWKIDLLATNMARMGAGAPK